jgi:hypothetical protein
MPTHVSRDKEYEAALLWVETHLLDAAAKIQPDPDQLAQAFRVLFHAPSHVKRLPSPREQWFLVYSQFLWRNFS